MTVTNEMALRQIAEQDDTELMLDPTWAKRVAAAALSEQPPAVPATPIGYIREAGVRSLQENCHTSLMPSQAEDYIIPVYTTPPADQQENERLRQRVKALEEALRLLCDHFDTLDGEPFAHPDGSPWTVVRAALKGGEAND